MLKSFTRNIFRVYYTFIPSSKLITRKRENQNNMKKILTFIKTQDNDLKDSSIIFPSSKLSSSSLINQHILDIYSDLLNRNPSRKINRLSFKDPNLLYNSDLNLKRMTQKFTETISSQNHLFSLNAMKKCLILMKKIKEQSTLNNDFSEYLSQLEHRFYFLHDNYFIFEKKFKESIVILRSFTALNHKLSNKKYLNQWYKYALNNLRFLSTSEICDILYISVFQIPGNKELYDTVKLQLFRATPLYYQEVLKAKLSVDPKEYPRVVDFIKATITKLVLSSYQRKGLYWVKDFSFRLSDTVKLLQSYVIKGENNGAYLSLIVNILHQNLQENIKGVSDVFRNQKSVLKMLPIFVNLPEKEKKYLGDKYNQILDVFITFLINVIPSADIKKFLGISESFESLCKDAKGKPGLEVCKVQLLELLGKNVDLIKGKESVVGFSETFLKVFVNLTPVYLQKNKESEAQANNSLLERKYIESVNNYVEKISNVIEEVLLTRKESLLLINKILDDVTLDKENLIDGLRNKIAEIDFSKTKNTSTFALDYLKCFSLINLNKVKLSKNAQDNFGFFIDFLYNNLEIKSLNQEMCQSFFEVFVNLKKNQHFQILSDDVKEKLEKLQKSLLRYIADHYQKFSISSLEKILDLCMEGEILESDFDDGSGLYTQNMIQEVYEYATQHLKEFSIDFQTKINPFLEKYAKASAIETLAENIKNLSL